MAADRCRHYAADIEVLVGMLAHVAALADRADHAEVAARALEMVANQADGEDGFAVLASLQRLPALLCYYAAGLGATAAGNWLLLGTIATRPRWYDNQYDWKLATAVNPTKVFYDADATAQVLVGANPKQRRYTPVSDYLHDLLRPVLLPLVDTDERFDEVFDRFEYLAGLIVEHFMLVRGEGDPYILPGSVGRIRWRHQQPSLPPQAIWADQHADELAAALLPTADDPSAAWDAAKKEYDELIDTARQDSW